MTAKSISSVSILFLIASIVPCQARSEDSKAAMTPDEIRARVAEAHTNRKRLIVKLRQGGSVSGFVTPLSDGLGFELTHYRLLSGFDKREMILYSDVASIKGRNPFVKVMKRTAAASVTAGMIPVCLAATIFRLPLSRCFD